MCDQFQGCFKLFDIDKDGYITKQEMISVIDAVHRMVVSETELMEICIIVMSTGKYG